MPMKFSVLSGMADTGILTKKDRVLCFQDREGATLGWLRRQRFKVEGPLPAPSASGASARLYPLYDLVIVEREGGVIAAQQEHLSFLREALRHVRPGGRLLAAYSIESLFDAAPPEAIFAQLRNGLSKDGITSITTAPTFGSNDQALFLVKKGGAYKPRLPVKYVDEPHEFRAACERLAPEACIGLDVETTLKEPRILCTVQMATDSVIYVADMLPIKDLKPLKALMENPAIMKIIHNKDFEAAVLGQYGIQILNVYDTLTESRKRYKQKGGGGHRLGEVCERELGVYLDKSYQASDWTKRPLTQEQLDYAAADAEVMIRLYQTFVPPEPPTTMELF